MIETYEETTNSINRQRIIVNRPANFNRVTCDHGVSMFGDCLECEPCDHKSRFPACDCSCDICGLTFCVCCANCDRPTRLTAIFRNTDKMCTCFMDDEYAEAVDRAYDEFRDGVL